MIYNGIKVLGRRSGDGARVTQSALQKTIMIIVQIVVLSCNIYAQIAKPDEEIKVFHEKLDQSTNLRKLKNYFGNHTNIDCGYYLFGEPEINGNIISLQLEFSCGYTDPYLLFLYCFVYNTNNQEITVQDLIKNVTSKLDDWDKQKLAGFE